MPRLYDSNCLWAGNTVFFILNNVIFWCNNVNCILCCTKLTPTKHCSKVSKIKHWESNKSCSEQVRLKDENIHQFIILVLINWILNTHTMALTLWRARMSPLTTNENFCLETLTRQAWLCSSSNLDWLVRGPVLTGSCDFAAGYNINAFLTSLY